MEIIVNILKVIGLILLVVLLMICTSNVSFFRGHNLEDYRGSVIIKETPDSVGTIPIVRYDIIELSGEYSEISINQDDDFYNVGDTII